MASLDPFEARVRFSGMLQHLNASQNSAQKASQFAIKHASLSDDLHSCILEQLEKGNMNVQANMMHFLETFMDLARKEGQEEYVKLVQRDICKIVDIVTPPTGVGYMNVKTVRKILENLRDKDFLSEMLVSMLLQQLSAQEDQNQARLDQELPDAPPPPAAPPGFVANDKERTKRLVEQRVEEDRERHKRQREQIWQKTFEEEKNDLWENTSDYGEDDEMLGREEYEMRMQSWKEECPHIGMANGHGNGTEPVTQNRADRPQRSERPPGRADRADRPPPSAPTGPANGPGHGGGGGRRGDRGGRDRRNGRR